MNPNVSYAKLDFELALTAPPIEALELRRAPEESGGYLEGLPEDHIGHKPVLGKLFTTG